jgi:iron-sulfur cluster assembly accessory protein
LKLQRLCPAEFGIDIAISGGYPKAAEKMSGQPSIEPVVRLTESAAGEVKSQLGKPENSGKTLRVYVEQGGCSGMQYSMTFDEPRADDFTAEMHGVSVLVDAFSADYIRGAVVDYSDSLTGGGFKISNPKAKQSCGCGKSFTA